MIYQMGKKPSMVYDLGLLNEAELRIHKLFQLLPKYPPWSWDLENYADGTMDGKFYPDDFADIQQLESWTNDREGAAATRSRTQAAARQ